MKLITGSLAVYQQEEVWFLRRGESQITQFGNVQRVQQEGEMHNLEVGRTFPREQR